MIKAIRICKLSERGILIPLVVSDNMPIYFYDKVWKARCLVKPHHRAPVEACRCGLYSVSKARITICDDKTFIECGRDDILFGDAAVIVECLGKTIKHEAEDYIVYRSEIQIPQTIYISDLLDEYALAARYDCEVIKLACTVELEVEP